MKKILALVSLLLVVSPAFGANLVTLDVKLGGDNHAADWANGTVTPYTFGSDTPDVVYGTAQGTAGAIVNWSIDATVTVGENEDLVYGIANVVADLELSKDGTLVANFGLGSETTGGFFSSILDGDKDAGQLQADELKAAAFPWIFDVGAGGDRGRVFDPRTANGPNLQQHTYPSTLNFPAGSTALSGTLVGMGAGYTQYTGPNQSGQETAGVGIPVGTGFGLPLGEFCVGLGSLVAEGQLNVSGLPNGTYTLKVLAGAGINVLKNDGQYYCDDGTPGNFASKADQAVGDQITFIVNNAVVGCTIPPAMATAVSRRTHTNVGDFDNVLNTAGAVTVEPRTGGTPRIVVTYDKAIGGTPSVVLTGGTLGAVTMAGSELTIGISGITNGACVSATISGVGCAEGGAVAPDHTVKFRFLQGDVNRNNATNVNDVNQVKSSLNQPVTLANFLRDVNANGVINVNDVNIVKAGLNKVPDACTY